MYFVVGQVLEEVFPFSTLKKRWVRFVYILEGVRWLLCEMATRFTVGNLSWPELTVDSSLLLRIIWISVSLYFRFFGVLANSALSAVMTSECFKVISSENRYFIGGNERRELSGYFRVLSSPHAVFIKTMSPKPQTYAVRLRFVRRTIPSASLRLIMLLSRSSKIYRFSSSIRFLKFNRMFCVACFVMV